MALVTPNDAPAGLLAVCAGLALYRLVDIYRSSLRVVLLETAPTKDEVFSKGEVFSITRSVVLTVVNYFELIFAFAITYRFLEGMDGRRHFEPEIATGVDAIFYSASIATAGGFSGITASTDEAQLLTVAEVLLGFTLIIVVLGLFLSSRRIRELIQD